MARMDVVMGRHKDNPEAEIYVIYYGARYRKNLIDFDKRKNDFTKLKLSYPHRDDALNQAKAIPLYLTTYYPDKLGNSMKNKIKLIDGGFREKIEFEIWLVPNGTDNYQPRNL